MKCSHIYIQLLIILINRDCSLCNNVIDVDDILSEDYMPGTLLVLENPKEASKYFNESHENNNLLSKHIDGTFNNAMQTMGFHRLKMNEYLCRSYIAEQIVNEMTLSRMKRRMGTNPLNNNPSKMKMTDNNDLLSDEGSSNYKDWLSKSTTLEDIYRHYATPENRIDENGEEETDKDDEPNEEYDGHLTGYVYQPNGVPKLGHSAGGGGYYGGGGGGGGGGGHGGYPYPPSPPNHGSGHGYAYGGGGGGHSGYGSGGGTGYDAPMPGHSGGGGHPGYAMHEHEHIVHEPPHPKYQVYKEESHQSKGHDLSDLFDIALTALAFLSFKMFLIHVIMCISMTNGTTTTTAASIMMPMSMSSTATGTGTGTGTGSDTATGSEDDSEDTERDTLNLRVRRDLLKENSINQELNELARRILASFEAALLSPEDNGHCLRKVLCENNKYSRNVKNNNKILIPIWSLGMSWLSGRIVKNVNPSVTMLDTLKASIFGLGKTSCEIIYQNCELREQSKKRKKRRRKRHLTTK